jgi:hypothetical protein
LVYDPVPLVLPENEVPSIDLKQTQRGGDAEGKRPEILYLTSGEHVEHPGAHDVVHGGTAYEAAGIAGEQRHEQFETRFA